MSCIISVLEILAYLGAEDVEVKDASRKVLIAAVFGGNDEPVPDVERKTIEAACR